MNKLEQNQYESSDQDGSLSFSRLRRVGALTTLIATGALFGANHASPALTREATSANAKITQTSALESQRSANLESLVPTTDKGHLEINGKPTIPRFYWAIDPSQVPRALADGINFFMQADNGRIKELSQAVGDKGYVLTADGNSEGMSNVIGAAQDEPDGYNVSPEQLPSMNSNFKVLNFTDHFASHEPALPVGKSAYLKYIANADMVGFDKYMWNRNEGTKWDAWENYSTSTDPGVINLSGVYNKQLELIKLANGKPTFQHIEGSRIDSNSNKDPIPSPAVYAEAWGSFLAGAKGIGWWCHSWTKGYHDSFDCPAENEAVIAKVNHEIDDRIKMLISPNINVGKIPDNDAVKAGAWLVNGKIVMGVVNLSSIPRNVNRIFPALRNQQTVSVVEDPMKPEVIRIVQTGIKQHIKDKLPLHAFEVRWYRYRPQAGVVLKDMVTGKPLQNNHR